MGLSQCIAYKYVGQRREESSKFQIIIFFTALLAQILEHQTLPFLKKRHFRLRMLNLRPEKTDRNMRHERLQGICDRTYCFSFASEISGNDYFRTVFRQILECRQSALQSKEIGNFAFGINRKIKTCAKKYTFTS